MIGFGLAWSFLTRLPGGRHPSDAEPMARAVAWFPVVGAVIGGLAGVVHLGLGEVVSAPIAALLAVAISAMATGAFHEDGLADTFDSLGGHTAERRLEIMRDSRIGTFGTLALVVATGLKVAALVQLDAPDGLLALVAAHTLGRTVAIGAMRAGPEARSEGLAVTAADAPSLRIGPVCLVVAFGAFALGPVTAAGAAGLVVIGAVGLGFARRRFGGITGDVLGALEQVGEIVVLVVAAEMLDGHGWLWF